MATQRVPRPGEHPRVPFEQAIALRFKYFGDFIEELSANLSMGGMFIRTGNPHPIGSIFEFELRLGDDFSLIDGKAQVVWARKRPEGEGLPAGMGVRFVELDDDSRQIVQRMVEEHLTRGGAPFELPAEPPPPAEPPEVEAEPPAGREPEEPSAADAAQVPPPAAGGPEDGPAKSPPPAAGARPEAATDAGQVVPIHGVQRARPSRTPMLPWVLLAVTALALLVVLLVVLRGPRPAVQSAPRTPAPGVTSGAATEPATAIPDAPAPAASGASGVEPASDPMPAAAETPEKEAAAALRAWSEAWTEQRVDDYLAAYSPDFRPPDGLGRTAWQRRRRAHILAPEWIRIGVAFVESERLEADRILLSFVQAYESNSFRDVVRKRMELRREEDAWRIVSERVER